MGRGIDYGMGMTNVDLTNGIRYGVISQNAVLQAWADSSEANYGKPDGGECPVCGTWIAAAADTDWGDVLHCEECERLQVKGKREYVARNIGRRAFRRRRHHVINTDLQCGGEIELELHDCAEPISFTYEGDGYVAECGQDGDIFITKSPYYTRAEFCSPCAPGACYITNPTPEGEKAYCFGVDWFDKDIEPCPYPIWRVDNDELVYTPAAE